MRNAISLLVAFALSGAAAAGSSDQAVKLEQQKSNAGTVSGMCGPASVGISNINQDAPVDATGFSGLHTVITIGSGKSRLTIGPVPEAGSTIFLQDRNKLHCMGTPNGPKLVLAMICYGRSCAPVDYRVIDPKTAKVINRLDNMDECDTACAEKALGVALPSSLREDSSPGQ